MTEGLEHHMTTPASHLKLSSPCLSHCPPFSLCLPYPHLCLNHFLSFKNLVLALLILQLPIRLRKQMPQKQAASESSFAPDSVRVIIAQGQSGTSLSVSAVRMFLAWVDGSE